MSTRVIADEHEIRNLVHRYADAASRRDPAGVASAFTTDGEWHAPELGHFKATTSRSATPTRGLSRVDVTTRCYGTSTVR
jgi:purine nucleoside permease